MELLGCCAVGVVEENSELRPLNSKLKVFIKEIKSFNNSSGGNFYLL